MTKHTMSKMMDYDDWQLLRLIRSGEPLVIVSGEGSVGTAEAYTGKRSLHAIKCRLTRERCGGDRWARIDIDRN